MGDSSQARYSRHIGLPQIGADGHARLRDAGALIVGMGGLGNPAAQYLASSGLGRLTLNDFDRVDLTNLPRQVLFGTDQVDRLKTEAAQARLQALNPEVDIVRLDRRLTADALREAVAQADIVLDCTDNFATRSQVNAACVANRTPLISGAAIRFEGQVAVFANDGTGPCYNCLYTAADDNLDDCAGQGILAPVAGTIGSLMATETIKRIVGLDSDLVSALWVYDGLAGTSRLVRIARRADCSVCHTD